MTNQKTSGVIRFVRKYYEYGLTVYEVCYESWRVFSYINKIPPKTVLSFIAEHTEKKQYDRTFHRDEYIYQ